jgi:hypothetical protein
MIQTVLAINGQDCTIGSGNTAEEYEAIAVTLLRTAEAVRNREEVKLECVGHDGKVLAWVHVHVCGPSCDEHALVELPIIEQFDCVSEPRQSLRAVLLSMIDQYRNASKQAPG